MSRYPIESPRPDRDIIVGWDPPLGTFFAQEYRTDVPADEEDMAWWVGYIPNELPSLETLRAKLSEREIVLDDETAAKLKADSDAEWTPGPLQRMLGFTGKE